MGPLALRGACERTQFEMETRKLALPRERQCGLCSVTSGLWAILLIAVAVGCGRDVGPPLIPVTGKVTINGQPASEGGVVFRDMNHAMVQLIGAIESDGKYSIMYNRRLGAPPGKYRVTVLVTETKKGPDGKPTGLPRTLSNSKFSDPKKTPLEVEVKEGAAPEAFNLAVTK